MRAIASLTSRLGGSSIPISPTNVRLFSVAASVYLSFSFLGISLYANARTRSAFFAISFVFSSNFVLASFVKSTLFPLIKIPVHLSRIDEVAPLLRTKIS